MRINRYMPGTPILILRLVANQIPALLKRRYTLIHNGVTEVTKATKEVTKATGEVVIVTEVNRVTEEISKIKM